MIFDEAHELEDVASSYFGISLSNVRLEELVRDVETVLRARQAHSSALKGCGDMLRERSRMFFGALPRGSGFQAEGRMPFEQREQFLEEHGDVYLAVMNALHRLEGELERLRGVEESMGLKKRVADIREHLRFLMEAESVNTVFWIERRGGSSDTRNTQYLSAGDAHRCLRVAFRAALRAIPQRDSHFCDADRAGRFCSLEKAAWFARCAGVGGAFSFPL